MLFQSIAAIVQRRLVSLLQPWLREEAELKLNLGFINSRATVKNLRFDTSALNGLLNEPARFRLSEFTVDELTFRFSSWNFPAFSMEVRGVNATITYLEEVEEVRRSTTKSSDASETRKKKLNEIDPEGGLLHSILERILDAPPSKNWLETSFWTLILNHCSLHMMTINLQVQLPVSNEPLACFLDIKELKGKSQDFESGCLFVAVAAALFRHLRESSFVMEFNGFEMGYSRKDVMKYIWSSSDLFFCIKLTDLQPVNFDLHILELKLCFCPEDIFVFSLFGKPTSNKVNFTRSGRQLWKLAANKMGSIISLPRLTLHNLVTMICLWLRYINAYAELLSLSGYCSSHPITSSVKMSNNKSLIDAKHIWGLISEIEKEMPVESIAQGRQIARCRATRDTQKNEHILEESTIKRYFRIICMIFLPLICIWKVISRMYQFIVPYFVSKIYYAREPKFDRHHGFIFYSCQKQYSLNLERVSIIISSSTLGNNVNEEVELHAEKSHSKFLSFQFSVDSVILIYGEKDFKNSLLFAIGKLKASSSVIGAFDLERSSKVNIGSNKGQQKEMVHNLKTILWGEPAKMFPAEAGEIHSTNHSDCAHVPFLRSTQEELWLRWDRACINFQDSGVEYSNRPFILCEVKSYLTHSDFKNLDSGFSKCTLTVGKLNLALECSSILSISLLLGRIQHASAWTKDYSRTSALSHQQEISDQQSISWDAKHDSHASQLKIGLIRMHPKKHMKVGIFVVGPCIKMSMGKVVSNGANEEIHQLAGQDELNFVFDIHNFEAAVWPISKSAFTSSIASREYNENGANCPTLQEPQMIDIPKLSNENYTSRGWISLCFYLRINGLNAYLGDLASRRQSHFLEVKPIDVQLTSFREHAYSFCSTVIANSAALHGTAMGFTFRSYTDELYGSLQVIACLFSDVIKALHEFDSAGYVHFQELTRETTMPSRPVDEETSTIKGPLICYSTLLSVNCSLKLMAADVILHNSKRSDKRGSANASDTLSGKKMVCDELSKLGMWTSLYQPCAELSTREGKIEILVHVSGINSVIFMDDDHMAKSSDKILLQKSLNCLYEILISNCSFNVCVTSSPNAASPISGRDTMGVSTLQPVISSAIENSPLMTQSKNLPALSSTFIELLGFASDTPAVPSDFWMVTSVVLGEVVVTRGSLKGVLLAAHQANKLFSSLSLGGNFQSMSWKTQGGIIFIEATALAGFHQFFTSYLLRVADTLSIIRLAAKVSTESNAREALDKTVQSSWKLLENLNLDMLHFLFVLVGEDESGGIWELISEVEVHINLESAITGKKFTCDLSRLSMKSQMLPEKVKVDSQIPHFSSVASNQLSAHSISGVLAVTNSEMDRSEVVGDGSELRYTVNEEENSVKPSTPEVLLPSLQNNLLKHLVASVSLEKPNSDPPIRNQMWVGSCSVSGFDMTLSLSEIQILLSMVSSFSNVSSKEKSSHAKQGHVSSNQRIENSRALVPDGAIVAIQDVHQHVYFTAERDENKYSLVASFHHSLVGEKALFRVKHHTQRIWKSSVLWFSLVSLYAKSASGEPLRLNSLPGSGFVNISSTDDSNQSLWRVSSTEAEGYKGDIDWEPYNQLIKKTFYLVNKKNDCAVAFVDGIPEFVKKPGHQFKFKVFNDLTLSRDLTISNRYCLESSETGRRQISENEENCADTGDIFCVEISIHNLSLTIDHEFSDTRERIPLLHGCISDIQLNVQILSTKTRIVGTSRFLLNYFDSQRNIWSEIVHPVEICLFHRSRVKAQGSEVDLHGVPVHFYCRSKGMDVSLSELSLDILLFIVGTLKLAGPFSVKSSMILANFCKVENQSGLNLLCYVNDKQSVTIAREQSASISLRHSVSASRPSEVASVVMIKLSNLGSLSTSAIPLSLIEARSFAWRTRVTSLADSRMYPGPFMVVDILRKSEDGLSVVVSPLLRIHNKTEFPMELRFRRPEQNGDIYAAVSLKAGDTMDDSMAAFGAISLSGGLKKALLSLSVGNFLFSFRPEISDGLQISKSSVAVEWSDELRGGKAVRISGIFDKLSYEVRRALSNGSMKQSWSTTHCSLKFEAGHQTNIHFLIQSTGRNVPIVQPDKSSDGIQNSSVALQEQREICLLPTVRVSNLLHSEIHVVVTETDASTTIVSDNIGRQATISHGSTADFYADPAKLSFIVTLTAFSSSSKTVTSGDWVKKLRKTKSDVSYFDIDLDFSGGKYFASLRLFRGERGILEAVIYTPYAVKNETDLFVFICAPNQSPISSNEVEKNASSISPELGLYLPPKSAGSWFSKSRKVQLKILHSHASIARLDLDALSGLTEISLEVDGGSKGGYITKLGASLQPLSNNAVVPSQIVTMVPRYVVVNESEESISVRQCYLQDDMRGIISIGSMQRKALQLQDGVNKRREFSLFENLVRKHRNDADNSLTYIQFHLNTSEFGWSGPVSISSLGHFFVKFRKQSSEINALENNKTVYAAIHVLDKGSSLLVHFHKPVDKNLPYRIENRLHDASLTYYQKDSTEQEVLKSANTISYAWDDTTLPHKLVVLISGMNLLREISLDKLRSWKPFVKRLRHMVLGSHLLPDRKIRDLSTNFAEFNHPEMARLGYEVYAEGKTRVLRFCEFSDIHKGDRSSMSFSKIQLRLPHLGFHLLEKAKQDIEELEESYCAPIVDVRLEDINIDSLSTDQEKYNQIDVESIHITPKWKGSPVASMLRRHQSDGNISSASIFTFVFILLPADSNVRQVKYSSIALQPLNLNLDEETLMKIASFWRTSLSDSGSPSQQYYFDHFEVLPVKIIASFLPVDSYSSYNSAQDTLRSFLHSVVKVPTAKNLVVELNGVLVSHALITLRELCFKCARHYSWYGMRAIYIAKGSQLLPPAFASIFDDLSSSSLDVFFDPSHGLVNLPGLTIGTFKFISKYIHGKGLSGTKRYFGDFGKTLRTAGSNVLFAAVTEVSDSVLKGSETSGVDGMLTGFHQGILKLAMEPSLLGTALMEGGADRKIKLDRSAGIDELYIEGYLQAMLDTMYRQEYLRVRVIDDQVFLKNLPPNSALIDEILDRVKGVLVSKALMKGENSTSSPLRHLRGENEWKLVPTVVTLFEHLFVSFAINKLRERTGKLVSEISWIKKTDEDAKAVVPAQKPKVNIIWKWGIGKFVLSGILAYIDGRLCRSIPNPVARRIVSGFVLSFLDNNDND